MISRENFWDDPDAAKPVLKERTLISNQVEKIKGLEKEIEDCEVLMELAEEEDDPESRKEAAEQAGYLKRKIKAFSLELMLSDKDDTSNAIISINAGAGGTEADRKSVV